MLCSNVCNAEQIIDGTSEQICHLDEDGVRNWSTLHVSVIRFDRNAKFLGNGLLAFERTATLCLDVDKHVITSFDVCVPQTTEFIIVANRVLVNRVQVKKFACREYLY